MVESEHLAFNVSNNPNLHCRKAGGSFRMVDSKVGTNYVQDGNEFNKRACALSREG